MRKRMMTLSLLICVSFALSACGKASKQEIIESEYYQKLQDQNEKLTQDLKKSRAREDSLDKKIKEIHEYTGDQKLASYKKEVADSTISKTDFVRIQKGKSFRSFAVTNEPVCSYVKNIVKNAYRIIGLTVTDLRENYSGSIYSYALIDEDNTTYEFKVYGSSYIVFDSIPENVYCFDNAGVIGDGLIDAENEKIYASSIDRMKDAALVVTDQDLKFNDTAIKTANLLEKAKKTKEKQDVSKWTEYRFYTQGTVTKLSLSDSKELCITDKTGSQEFYTVSEKTFSKIKKLLK
ncbi:hypothetical protein [Anaerostipes sp.]|uniref:hypothetical protein n=1 Tax=Anaerostipes sp. TaxID=1872530 RepID=UPI0025BE432C|nr:hypothetical protein [Anaerostipes sp.]MBS7009258.1 hypothetical protein [Anaerostipes sp.]